MIVLIHRTTFVLRIKNNIFISCKASESARKRFTGTIGVIGLVGLNPLGMVVAAGSQATLKASILCFVSCCELCYSL